jgi:hypothetical protein
VPFGAFLTLAIAILPCFAGGDTQIAYAAAILEAADFRVRAEVPDEHDFIEGTGHYSTSFAMIRARRRSNM